MIVINYHRYQGKLIKKKVGDGGAEKSSALSNPIPKPN